MTPDANANDGALTVENIRARREEHKRLMTLARNTPAADLDVYNDLRGQADMISIVFPYAIDRLLAEVARLQAELSTAVSRNEAYAIELDDATKALAWKGIGLADGDSVANGIERLFENLTVRANRLTADNDDLYERLSRAAEIMQSALDSDAAQAARIAALEAALTDIYLLSFQLTVQSRLSAAQPGSDISTCAYLALGEDVLKSRLEAMPVERAADVMEGRAVDGEVVGFRIENIGADTEDAAGGAT